MSIHRRHAVATLALVLILPLASAGWSFWSSVEPDTPYDIRPYMWPDAPGSETKRIYFAAISTYDDGDINPNVAVLELGLTSRVEVPADERHEAILGVWIDCNGDGYIGHALSAVREYRNELLTSRLLCPARSGSVNSWSDGAHNYNNWVSELVPIGGKVSNVADYQRDKRVYRDDEAMVWGDHGRPDDIPSFRSCPLNPQPRGTYQSTGGLINYVDCRADLLGPANAVFTATGADGFRFTDEDDARTGPLGRIETFGSEDSRHSPVVVQDCSKPYIVRSGDELNKTGLGPATAGGAHDYEVHPVPAEPVRNTEDPTIPGFYNETNEGLRGDCDTSNDRGADFYGGLLGEDDVVGVDPTDKRRASWNFRFTISNRGGFPVSLVPGSGGNAGANENDAGLHVGGSRWLADSSWATKTGPQIARADLGGAKLAPAWWLTFYAHTGSATALRGFDAPGGSGVYGSSHCGSATAGIHRGWNCDADLWYVNADGSAIPENNSPLARPGALYEFRDVDCYDGEVADAAGAGAAYYGDEPCP